MDEERFSCPRRHMPAGPADHWREDGTCSYCGSLHPAEFLKKVEQSELVGPTDKSYKAYIGERGKFYFQHLDDDQQKEFIRLLNEKQVNIGFPGHFYVLPFFIQIDKEAT